MPGPEVPFPLVFKDGSTTGIKMRLGRGTYRAFKIGNYVKVQAADIAMSGLHARAELVHVPTFAPPLRFKLEVFETDPQLMNLIFGSAETQFESSPTNDTQVTINDSKGDQVVEISDP